MSNEEFVKILLMEHACLIQRDRQQGDALFYAADTIVKLRAEVERMFADKRELMEGLMEITKGKGRFSRDPFEHAANTIEDMKGLARALIEKHGGSSK